MTPGGPKTARGKARSRKNAIKHGLSSRLFQTDRSQAIAALTPNLSEGHNEPKIVTAARRAARAMTFLDEVNTAREVVINATRRSQNLAHTKLHSGIAEASGDLLRLDRFERNARAQWRKAAADLDLAFLEAMGQDKAGD